MTKIPIDHELLERYQKGTCTPQEQAAVDAWYLNLLSNGTRPDDEVLPRIQKQMWKELKPTKRKTLRLWLTMSSAAVVALVCYLVVAKQPKAIVAPIIALQDSKPEVIKASDIENTMVKLNDGSLVILEKGSKLLVDPSFNKVDRQITLLGKAFFDVAHNAKKPFIIYSKNLKTKVLGTAFDISPSSDAKTIRVNVIRGLVEVTDLVSRKSTKLKKNMQVVYNEKAKTFKSQPVDAAVAIAWNKQDLEFNDIAIKDAIPKLEEQFGYKIKVKNNSLNEATFTYSMRAKESMESFVKSICVFIGATYDIDHQNRIITINQ